jgi:hypothetical protein
MKTIRGLGSLIHDLHRPVGILEKSILILALFLLVTACRAGSAVRGDVAWDTDPSALIVRFHSPYTTAGLAGAFDDRYYVPEVQIWGDGRIIWVTEEGSGRRIWEGHLSTEEMEALLRRIVEAGFFSWEDEYYTPGGHSMPPMHLMVNLTGRSKQMSEHGGAPDAYYELEALLRSGAGAEGDPYVPSRGYLTVEPLTLDPGGPEWPHDADVTPDGVGEGTYIEGEALAFAWKLVNQNPTAPVYVSYRGDVYRIMVQIPGVSYFEPPGRRGGGTDDRSRVGG